MKKNSTYYLFMVLFLMLNGTIMAQQINVQGKVTAAEDPEGLPGVSIVAEGTGTGTVSDINGNFSINVPNENTVLVFSYIGYASQSITIGNQQTLNVVMQPEAKGLDEFIVTAFGISQEKKSLGYSAQNIDAEAITKVKQPNLVNSLQGQAAGVQITNSGGAPGQSARIIIRGINSLDPGANNQPLFVVDGVPVDNSTIESTGTPRGLSNRMADLNPNDVASISVLKGAAATALYGVRAANGAVIVTTKKGKEGEVRVNYNGSVGFETLNQLPKLQDEYGQGFSGEYQPSSFWPAWGAPIAEVQQTVADHKYQDNWRRAFNTGVQIDNNISISGGNEKATFYGSFGNLKQDGIIPFSTWERTTAKLSGSVKVSEKFNFSGSVNYSNSGGNRVPHDRFMERMMYWSETTDVRDYINEDGTMRTYSNTNPIYDARFATYEDDVNRVIGNINLNYMPTDWLSFSYRLGNDFYSDQRTEITPGPKGIDGEVPLSSTGYLEETRINSRDLTSNFYITLKKQFSTDLNTSLRLGNDIFERKYDRVTARGENFVIPEFYNLSVASQIFTSQGKSIRRLVGFYGDLMVDYKNYLFLNITGRNDISSTLPKDNNSFFYSSFNLGYVFSEHMDVPSWLTFGKLRASWAQVGKDTDPHILGSTYVSPSIFPLNGQVGFTRNSVYGDLALKPEQTTSIEFGLQTAFLNNRANFDVTYYKSNAKDQIIPVPVSDATGFSSYITNAGEIQNSGFEFILGGSPITTNDFTWNISANLSINNNEIKSIREGIDEIVVGSQFGYSGSTVTMKLLEGEAYGNIFGSSYERLGADPDNIFLDRSLPIIIGTNGFPVRTGTQLVLGNAVPKWIGGIRNDFTYRDFEFSFLIDFRTGLEQYNQYANFLSAFGKNEFTEAREDFRVFEGVLADGSTNTKEVWLGQGEGPDGVDYGAGYWRNYYRTTSENFVNDASYIKLRNITLGYNLNPDLLEQTPFRTARVSIAANNIILYTPWDGFDPESFSAGAGGNAVGFTGLGYPGVQSFFFNLNLGL
ncbi:SusC/RagA family TonB-linked outer membrane protein [Cyclobacterium marinum]|uniref:TonB-dependent receptor plug n=1 Tax=Cyclobacterium marinum (strain ATCC 25205 / DSM 745 / LMG 13164 / NCIMB 1802) TaxID=880070 RepID=G0IX77_CYCMS|nr:SusC/RagA family TonB-linked outer membrane protein [Cyclobacterium marinum]AEL25625.1 TonB-dependent receptor plug [Cyclobacterium marinum DSM 745]|tara:strand:- start:4348 stop:7443 length:3096 start_codon:yes stop_codon:yes gene_type:complete